MHGVKQMKVEAQLTGDRLAVKKLLEELDLLAKQLKVKVNYHEVE